LVLDPALILIKITIREFFQSEHGHIPNQNTADSLTLKNHTKSPEKVSKDKATYYQTKIIVIIKLFERVPGNGFFCCQTRAPKFGKNLARQTKINQHESNSY
jgi:hypothetical protein